MKPNHWDEMDIPAKRKAATSFFSTMRGQYIIGQALAVAVEAMKKEKYPEFSNIEDMQMLGEALFSFGYSTTAGGGR